jgi:hypothetical protein
LKLSAWGRYSKASFTTGQAASGTKKHFMVIERDKATVYRKIDDNLYKAINIDAQQRL